MNARIKELAEQSYERKQSMVIDPTTHEMVPGKTYSKELNQEKFAELIIRECIKAAGDPGDGLIKGDTWHDGVRASIWSIQQEFGFDRNFGIES
jgi:hypothetical protein